MTRYSSTEKKAGTARQPTMTVVSASRPPQQRYGRLTVHTYPTIPGMAVAAASDVAAVLEAAIGARGEANAMFATGNSQLAMLDGLAGDHGIEWAAVRVFHMDEYVGLPDDHPASFARYIRERIVDKVHPREAFYVGNTPSAANEYATLLRRW